MEDELGCYFYCSHHVECLAFSFGRCNSCTSGKPCIQQRCIIHQYTNEFLVPPSVGSMLWELYPQSGDGSSDFENINNIYTTIQNRDDMKCWVNLTRIDELSDEKMNAKEIETLSPGMGHFRNRQ